MSLKTQLNNDRQTAIGKGKCFYEVEMFRSMLNYFNGRGCRVIELHQHNIRNQRTKQECEISDLLIVSYSHRHPCCIKVTFLQAKRATKGFGLTPNNTAFKFGIDTRQYTLLKDCPPINPLNTNLDPNILYDSCSPSITSYGVFYEQNQSLDFAYEVTQLLKLINPVPATPRFRVCYFDSINDTYGIVRWRNGLHCPCRIGCCNHGYCTPDLLSTIDADSFEKALKEFQIGSPMCFEQHKSQIISILVEAKKRKKTGNELSDFENFVLSNLDQYRPANESRNNRRGDDERINHDDIIGRLNPSHIMLVNVDEFNID
ncbi:MAG: hypothetical protein KBT27_14820 [Prevotellaceae bacterium]|nr:hypothetical protein [Candidatus Faecinaster equi]